MWGSQQGIDLRGGEEDRKTFLGFGQRDGHERVGGETFSLAEKAVKAAQRGKVETDGGTRAIALHEGEEVSAEIIGRSLGPGLFTEESGRGGQGAVVVAHGAWRGVAFVAQVIEISRREGIVGSRHGGQINSRRGGRESRSAAAIQERLRPIGTPSGGCVVEATSPSRVVERSKRSTPRRVSAPSGEVATTGISNAPSGRTKW